MTRQETLKKRIRARMERTGERYTSARKALLDRTEDRSRTWVSEPEMSEGSVHTATGRGWDEWCDIIDAWPGRAEGHTAIAHFLTSAHGIDGWWAQSVTVGYERITGLRLPYQRSDGTFTAAKSKTITVDPQLLRKVLLHPGDHNDLFPGEPTELRSKPTAKSIRIGIGDGVALFTVEPKDADRCKVTVTHEKLPALEDVERWRFYWSEWLAALDGS